MGKIPIVTIIIHLQYTYFKRSLRFNEYNFVNSKFVLALHLVRVIVWIVLFWSLINQLILKHQISMLERGTIIDV